MFSLSAKLWSEGHSSPDVCDQCIVKLQCRKISDSLKIATEQYFNIAIHLNHTCMPNIFCTACAKRLLICWMERKSQHLFMLLGMDHKILGYFQHWMNEVIIVWNLSIKNWSVNEHIILLSSNWTCIFFVFFYWCKYLNVQLMTEQKSMKNSRPVLCTKITKCLESNLPRFGGSIRGIYSAISL